MLEQPQCFFHGRSSSRRGPFAPRLFTIAHTLRECDDTLAEATGPAIARVKVFEVLTRTEGTVVESIGANLLTSWGVKIGGLGWDVSQPRAQLAVNSGFTISTMSFNILKHLVKPPEGCEPR